MIEATQDNFGNIRITDYIEIDFYLQFEEQKDNFLEKLSNYQKSRINQGWTIYINKNQYNYIFVIN